MGGKKTGTGPDDRGYTMDDLFEHAVPMVDEEAERAERAERKRVIAEVREQLKHPKDHKVVTEDGREIWVKAPVPSAANVEDILNLDPWYADKLRKNAFSYEVEWEGEKIKDPDITRVRTAIGRDYKMEPSLNLTSELINYVAECRSYHPVRDWLNGLKWDGVPRMSKLLAFYAGSEETDLNAVISRRFLISCVARIMVPGCKVDTVLILVGEQGTRKSTFFETLAGALWFRDSPIDIRNKDAFVSLKGVWIYEMAELDAMRPREATTVKAFLSSKSDTYRPPYGRNNVTQKRQVVFVGSTNERSFLADPTGARRFWPTQVNGHPRIIELGRDRDQIWAETVAAYAGGERHWLEENEGVLLKAAQEQYQHEDTWEAVVVPWMATNMSASGHSVAEILSGAINMDVDKQGKQHVMRMSGILTKLGMEKKRTRKGDVRAWRWVRPVADLGGDGGPG
jgi:putative DNA primase/helicase